MNIYPPCNHIYYDLIIDNVLKYTWLGNAKSNGNARNTPFQIFLEYLNDLCLMVPNYFCYFDRSLTIIVERFIFVDIFVLFSF